MQTDQAESTGQNSVQNRYPYGVWGSIQKIPALLAECLENSFVEQVDAISRQIVARDVRKVFLLGTGSSYFTSISEGYAFEKIARIPAASAVTSVFRAYPPSDLDAHSAVFFHSHSGKTEGDLDSVNLAKAGGAYTVGVTDIAVSDLAAGVDDVLLGPGGKKSELPATRTYVTALMRMILLTARIGQAKQNSKDADACEQNLKSLPEKVAELMANCDRQAQDIVDRLKDCSTLISVGYGPNAPTAAEAAMAFNQSAGIPAQSYELDNFIHGPIQALRPGMGVFIIAAPGPMRDKSLALAQACKTIGAKVVVLAAQQAGEDFSGFDAHVAMPDGLLDLVSPIAYMTPFWQLSFQFGLLGKGCTPDRLSMDRPEFQAAMGYLMHKDKWISK